MSEVSERLDVIAARAADCQTYNFGLRNADQLAHNDVPYLIDLVRKQAAALEAVRGLHQPVIEDGQPVGCSECDWDAVYPREQWPCPTLSALEVKS